MVFFQSLLQTIRPPLLLIILGHLPYIPLVSNAIPVWTILLDYEILHVPFATVLVPPWLVVRVILSILWQYRVLSPLHISGRRTRSDEDVGRSLLFVICSGARTTVTWCWGLIVVLYLYFSKLLYSGFNGGLIIWLSLKISATSRRRKWRCDERRSFYLVWFVAFWGIWS